MAGAKKQLSKLFDWTKKGKKEIFQFSEGSEDDNSKENEANSNHKPSIILTCAYARSIR